MLNLNRRTAVALGGLLLAIGAFGPWITVLGLIGAGPANFTEVAIIVYGGIGLIAISSLTRRFMRSVSIVVGALVLIEVAYVWFHLSEQDTNQLVTPGWGLWFTTAACLYLIASTFVAKHPPVERYRIASVTVAPSLEQDFDNEKPGSYGPPKSA